ncbi:MAG TPA: CAP domain-containing protein [Gemmatimonadaceae bacterium]
MGATLVAGCSGGSTGPDAAGSGQLPPTSGAMAELAQGVVAEVNRVRTDPQGYANYLESLLPYYDGTVLRVPGETPLQTREGRPAAEEAIRVLRGQARLPALTWSDGMARSAYDHVLDLGPRGMTGHIGSDGSTPSDRVNRYGTWVGYVSENVDFGPDRALLVVRDFVIDDAVPDRGHRRNILDGSIRVAGAACGAHAQYRTMCVVDHAAGYVPR